MPENISNKNWTSEQKKQSAVPTISILELCQHHENWLIILNKLELRCDILTNIQRIFHSIAL